MATTLDFHKKAVRNSTLGLEITTSVSYGGYDWHITTSKNKRRLETNAYGGRYTRDKEGWTTQLFSDPSFTLIKEEVARLTPAKLEEQHNKAIIEFTDRVEKGNIPVLKNNGILEEGTIVSYSDQSNPYNEFVVTSELCMLGDNVAYSLDAEQKAHVSIRAIEGLGGWKRVNKPIMSFEEIEVIKSRFFQYQSEQDRLEKAKAQAKAIEVAENIEKGKLISLIPSDATHIIIGELQVDESDFQIDYFAHSTSRVVILAFSNKKRNDFNELRKAALNYTETSFLDSDEAINRDRMMLGESRYNGWNVRKIQIPKADNIYQLAGKGNSYFVPNSEVTPIKQLSNTKLLLIDYSEKALALLGDSRSIKDELKSLGGRFNPNLSHNGSKVAGWVFPKSQYSKLQLLLG